MPLLGPLLTGGKDGGLFAISYQLHGPLDDLKTAVNMMSAMTPGRVARTVQRAARRPPTVQPPLPAEMQRAP